MNDNRNRQNTENEEIQAGSERRNVGKERTGIEQLTGVERLLDCLRSGTARLLSNRRLDGEELLADAERMREDFARMQAEFDRHPGGGSHLSDEQFTELLLGETPTGAQVHLRSCTQCSEEAERVSGAMGDFSQMSRLWAERRTASQPMLTSDRRIGGWFGTPVWMLRPQTWMAAALTFVLVGGIGVSRNSEPLRGGQTMDGQRMVASTPIAQPVAVAPATLKADNDLLAAIDSELRADEFSVGDLYGLNAGSHGDRSRAAKRIAE